MSIMRAPIVIIRKCDPRSNTLGLPQSETSEKGEKAMLGFYNQDQLDRNVLDRPIEHL